MKPPALPRPLPLVLLVLVLSALGACGGGERADSGRVPRDYSIEELMGNVELRGAAFGHDGRSVLVSSDVSGVFNVYAVPLDGGEPEPLTTSTDEAIMIAACFPNDARFVYTSDRGGNELHHVFVRELDGSITDMTPGEEHTARYLGWSDDARSFFISTNQRDRRYFDLYEIDAQSYERSLLYEDATGTQIESISPDRRYLALKKTHTRANTDVFLYDRESSRTQLLTEHEGSMFNEAEAFSADGRSLYLLSDEGSEFRYLARVDLASGEREIVIQPPWDVMYARRSAGGRYLVVTVNDDARTAVHLIDLSTGMPVRLPELPTADISSIHISRDERWMTFYVSSGRSPRDLHLMDLEDRSSRRLTQSLHRDVDADDLCIGETVRFSSWDGMEIPGLLYRPHGASASQPAPALVWVHGGPGGQSRVGYHPLIQYLVNHGYAVYAINNRGSSGYGKSFFAADDRKHGDADLKDCISSKAMLAGTGFVDPDRIGIIGGSYGGYIVLAALAFAPEEFELGIDLFGISNWVRTLEQMPAWWEAMREALYSEMGHPEEDREYLRAISPLFHAEKIARPLMVLQGANDPRVHKVESDDIVAAVRANNVPVEYLVFDDEGHGFRRKENQIEGYRRVLGFLDEHLAAATAQPQG